MVTKGPPEGGRGVGSLLPCVSGHAASIALRGYKVHLSDVQHLKIKWESPCVTMQSMSLQRMSAGETFPRF